MPIEILKILCAKVQKWRQIQKQTTIAITHTHTMASYRYDDWANRSVDSSSYLSRSLGAPVMSSTQALRQELDRTRYELESERQRERQLSLETTRTKMRAEGAEDREHGLRSRQRQAELDLDTTMSALRSSRLESNAAAETSRMLVQDLNETRGQLERTQRTMNETQRELNVTAADYRARMEGLRTDNENLQRRLDTKTKEILDLKTQLSDVVRELRQKDEAMQFRSDVAERMEGDMKFCRTQMAAAVKDAETLRRELDEKDDLIDRLNRKCEQLEIR